VPLTELLPHVNGALNAVIAVLLVSALVAILRGNRWLHSRLMVGAFCVGVLFVLLYVVQVSLAGHRRFPGDDWVRTFFLAVLTTHTGLAVVVVPLVVRALYLASKARFAEHRRLVRITYPAWLYVSVTGVLIYWMNNHLRPPS
jgi:putative membrane protein